MSIEKKNKDNIKYDDELKSVSFHCTPIDNDPLRFWTNHPTDNTLVDLHFLADGQLKKDSPKNWGGGYWDGPFSGRPTLIAELAPALQARTSMLRNCSIAGYLQAFRSWWRIFDKFEKQVLAEGLHIAPVQSVADVSEVHIAFARERGVVPLSFRIFLNVVDDTRKLLKMPPLYWVSPKYHPMSRDMISDDQAREVKIAIKQDWERVRKDWENNDSIREEAARRAEGIVPKILSDDEIRVLKNWQYFECVQKRTGELLPSSKQLIEGNSTASLCIQGIELRVMRSILFPTIEETDIAFTAALMGSGWNPSTLGNLDANSPTLITAHPKNNNQTVLSVDLIEIDDSELKLEGGKPRAKGKLQFCAGLAKTKFSPPAIVSLYLKRVAPLRNILNLNFAMEVEALNKLQASNADHRVIEEQYKKVHKLKKGCSSVWLYVDNGGAIKWVEDTNSRRYLPTGFLRRVSYLDIVLDRLNKSRAIAGKVEIPRITPSDFRDIFARWVYRQSGGNILAVMHALGHSRISSTVTYVENCIFHSENDEQARRFMTHLIEELAQGRVDLTILAQLVRFGPLTETMEARLAEYRTLMRSRVGVGCTDPRNPPVEIVSNHIDGRMCGNHRCLSGCSNAKYLPESLDGISMRVEELTIMFDFLPRETWLLGRFDKELEAGEYLLNALYLQDAVTEARENWRERIISGEHLIPGLGRISLRKESV